MVRVCAPGGRIVVVDAYAPGRSRAGRGVPPCRDIARPVSCAGAQPDGIAGAVSEAGLSKPEVTLYELPVELQELLARAFPIPATRPSWPRYLPRLTLPVGSAFRFIAKPARSASPTRLRFSSPMCEGPFSTHGHHRVDKSEGLKTTPR